MTSNIETLFLADPKSCKSENAVNITNPEHFIENTFEAIDDLMYAARNFSTLIQMDYESTRPAPELLRECMHGVSAILGTIQVIRTMEINATKETTINY